MLINKIRINLTCILFLFALSTSDAMSRLIDHYTIKNISAEDLLITVRYSSDRRILGLGVYNYGGDEVIKRPFLIQDPNPYLETFSLFTCDPEMNWGLGENGETLYNQTRSAKETLNIVISELIVYDMEGNIVLTLDDIHEENFEYTDQQRRLSPCIMVTQEMVQAGRLKYAGLRRRDLRTGY
jgi:hypothetical protein